MKVRKVALCIIVILFLVSAISFIYGNISGSKMISGNNSDVDWSNSIKKEIRRINDSVWQEKSDNKFVTDYSGVSVISKKDLNNLEYCDDIIKCIQYTDRRKSKDNLKVEYEQLLRNGYSYAIISTTNDEEYNNVFVVMYYFNKMSNKYSQPISISDKYILNKENSIIFSTRYFLLMPNIIDESAPLLNDFEYVILTNNQSIIDTKSIYNVSPTIQKVYVNDEQYSLIKYHFKK